jgi:hypothetical protein
MNRSPLRPWRRPQPELPALNRAISPWFRFEITDDCIEVLDRLVAVGPFSGEVELRASSVRLTGEVTAYARRSPTSWGYSIRHGLTLNDDAGQVHDVDFDEIQTLRVRLDHDGSSASCGQSGTRSSTTPHCSACASPPASSAQGSRSGSRSTTPCR